MYTPVGMALLVSRLDRMVIREIVPPAALGFVVYTFLLTMRAIFALVEQVFVRGVPAADALRLLLFSLPQVVVLTLPMGFLFGVLIAMGRMSSDSEIVALQAAGISARRLLWPVVLAGLVIAAANACVTLVVAPAMSREMRALRLRVFTNARALGRIEARVFHEGFANVLLYLREIDPDGSWHGVVMYDRSDPGLERLSLARQGRLLVAGADHGSGGGGEPWLELEDAVTHQFMPGKPATYRVNRNLRQVHRLALPDQGQARYRPGIRERGTGELVEILAVPAASPEEAKERRHAAVELHKRVAIPAACVVFAIAALPLGIGSRSAGRGRGFVLSIGVILFYYVTFNHGELLALEGRAPAWLGTWLPNLLLSGVSLLLLLRVGRWLGERGPMTGLADRLLARFGRRLGGAEETTPAGAAATTPAAGSRPAARRLALTPFPTLLDRYLARRLAMPLLLVLLSTSALYVVIDLTDRVDDIAKNHAPLSVILAYYWNLLPQVVLDVTPFAVLIAVLIVLTVLDRQLELTALKAAGVSVYRLMIPMVLLAASGTALLWTLEESVVPGANREAKRLLDRIKGREVPRSYRATDRQWLLSRDGATIYNFLRYEPGAQSMSRFTMFRIDGAMQLRYHLFADRVAFSQGRWVVDSGWFREFKGDGSEAFEQINRPTIVDVSEGPEYFAQEYRRPAEMTYAELAVYIREVQTSGYRPDKLVVRWYQKLSYPLSVAVMVLLALPYGLGHGGGRRVSTIQGIAIAVGLGIGYFMVVAVCGKMGEAELLPPAVAAWLPVALAALLAVNRMTTIRT